MTIEDFVKKFLNLQRYVPYLKEEKAKVQGFISGLMQFYKDKLEYYNLRKMDEETRREFFFLLANQTKE